nr:MAG TPA: putative peptidoglycan binding domain protein [Caudoviricetes sp.]
MGIIDNAVTWALRIAADDTHGYDQTNRWGPDYDCSSAIIQAWQNAGIPVKSKGATYTGNMYSVFKSCGFEDVTASVNLSNGSGLQYGDVLLNYVHHTAMYCGNGQIVQASINEFGKTVGGQTGDQTGREFCIRGYYNYPWNAVLRYVGNDESSETINDVVSVWKMRELYYKPGQSLIKGNDVKVIQNILLCLDYNLGSDGADGEYGVKSKAAVMSFQSEHNLEPDGICGVKTYKFLFNVFLGGEN